MTIQLAQNIRTFRKQRALTQEQLAEQLNVSRQSVSSDESADFPRNSLQKGSAFPGKPFPNGKPEHQRLNWKS